MNSRARMAPITFLGSIIAAFVVAGIGGLWFVQMQTAPTGSSASAAMTAQDAAAIFSLGRESVATTPGAQVVARLGLPRGADTSQVSWTLVPVAAGTRFTSISGTGTTVSFTAPPRGSLRLTAELASTNVSTTTATTMFLVASELQADAWNVATRGSVTVNGAPAIQGESLAAGARIDATRGEITFSTHANRRSGLDGSLRMSGSDFTVQAADIRDGRVLNTVAIERGVGMTKRLHSEVEHLDGQHYVAVQTPDAVAMVKGTTFDTVVSPDASRVEVEHGLVMVVDRYRYYALPHDVADGDMVEVDALAETQAGDDWLLAADSAGASGDVAPTNTELRDPRHNGTHSDTTAGGGTTPAAGQADNQTLDPYVGPTSTTDDTSWGGDPVVTKLPSSDGTDPYAGSTDPVLVDNTSGDGSTPDGGSTTSPDPTRDPLPPPPPDDGGTGVLPPAPPPDGTIVQPSPTTSADGSTTAPSTMSAYDGTTTVRLP